VVHPAYKIAYGAKLPVARLQEIGRFAVSRIKAKTFQFVAHTSNMKLCCSRRWIELWVISNLSYMLFIVWINASTIQWIVWFDAPNSIDCCCQP